MPFIQDQNRKEIRQSIVRGLGGVIGTATGGGDTSSLIDTYGLQGGDDEFNGRYVYMTKTAGTAATDKTIVSDYAGSTHDATLSPVVSGTIASGDEYELYPHPFNVDDVNDIINRAIIAASPSCLVGRVTDDNFTLSNIYEYDWLVPYAFGLDFKAVYSVEYVNSVGVKYSLHTCDSVWSELVDGDVTASVDGTINREGTGCLKLVVAAGCAAGDILATSSLTSTDIDDCDELEIWIYSTVALDAGDIQVLIDNTASCVSPLESLDIPATSANTWTRHVIDLANPQSDSSIISVGLKMIVDKGAFTLYADDIVASLSSSKDYKLLNPSCWSIVGGSTPKFKFTYEGKNVVGSNNQVRISGFSFADIFTDDSTDCEIDPDYVVEWSLAYLMLYHAKSSQLDIDNRMKLGELHLSRAESKKRSMSTNYPPDTRFV